MTRKTADFIPYAADGEQLIARTKESYDGALPSGNAVSALVLSRLGRLTGGQRWRDAAEMQLRYLAGAAERYPAGHGFALLVFQEALWPAEELVITAKETPGALLRLLREQPYPNLTVLLKTPENATRLKEIAPFTAAYPIPETGARYYLCRDGVCENPVEKLERLADKSSAYHDFPALSI